MLNKISVVFLLLIGLLLASCEDEPLEGDFGEDPKPSLVGTWNLKSFNTTISNLLYSTTVTSRSSLDYNVTFTETNFTTAGSYDYTASISSEEIPGISNDYTSNGIGLNGRYSVADDVMLTDRAFFGFNLDGFDGTVLLEEQTYTYEISEDGNTLTINQNETKDIINEDITSSVTTVGTSVWIKDIPDTTCPDASSFREQAKEAYTNDVTNKDLCVAYKAAIINEINACGDEDGVLQAIIQDLGECSGEVVATELGVLKVDFDEETFTADDVSAMVLENSISIRGIKGSNGESLSVTLKENKGEATYQLGIINGFDVNTIAYSEPNNTGSGVWIASTVQGTESQGELIITKIDTVNKLMSGTFSFTGNNYSTNESKMFTNGVFTDIAYEGDLTTNNGNQFFAKIDGEEFEEDVVSGVYTSIAGFNSIGITATKNNIDNITISLPGDIAAGTYDFSFGTFDEPSVQYNKNNGEETTIGEGKIIIESHDIDAKKVKGTFEFESSPLFGGASYTVTEGSFDVVYQ